MVFAFHGHWTSGPLSIHPGLSVMISEGVSCVQIFRHMKSWKSKYRGSLNDLADQVMFIFPVSESPSGFQEDVVCRSY